MDKWVETKANSRAMECMVDLCKTVINNYNNNYNNNNYYYNNNNNNIIIMINSTF